jgi:hypothetical protein
MTIPFDLTLLSSFHYQRLQALLYLQTLLPYP